MKQQSREFEGKDYLEIADKITDPFEGCKLALAVIEKSGFDFEYEVALDDICRHLDNIIERYLKSVECTVENKVFKDQNYNFECDESIYSSLKGIGDLRLMREAFRLKYLAFNALFKYHGIEVQ